MSAEEPKAWECYEQVANYLLERLSDTLGLGLERVEGKQKLPGKSGTDWEVDGKGVKTEDGAIVVIECRRYPDRRPNQEAMRAFAYGISDVDAAGGIMVTPLGVQEGAEKIASYEGIDVIRLNPDATETDFMLEFVEKVFIGASAKLRVTATITATADVSKSGETGK